ncbi:MAG TPA: ATP-binding cassette domain-containing protein [Anaerolineales bacterium]|nr:ATP-binding cassette domain-containing protein [Anaerolineales bacterium]
MDQIIIEDLRFAYPPLEPGGAAIPVLHGVNLRVRRGEVLGLLGPTGSGKSTLCLALAGLVPHSTGGAFGGNVTVAGLNTRRERVAALAQKVGLVFQDAESQLFNMTVEDEVAFGPESLGLPRETIAERVDWALRAVRMAAPEYLERSPFHLSGGQKQRVALAAILAMRPEILVLDEPTAELDPLGKAEVFGVLAELRRAQGMTMVIVEQDVEELARLADRVAVLAEGRIVLEGPPREIFAQPARLRALGLDAPQLSTVAALFREREGKPYHFFTLAEALETLRI